MLGWEMNTVSILPINFQNPFIPDVIRQMEADGIEKCICLILEPHYSFYSVMGYEKFLESKQIQFLVIKDWYQEEALLNYWADEIAKILKEKVKQDSFKVIFSAHSVPILPWILVIPISTRFLK